MDKPIGGVPEAVVSTLRAAIWRQRPVEMLTSAGLLRQACPHALGHKDRRLKVLVFQFSGASASTLPSDGAWRSFFLDEIASVKIIDGPWRSGRNSIAKIETSFDHIDWAVRPRRATN